MIRFRRLVVGSRTAGFTVAELVVVVLIIVVIGSVVVPTLIGQIAKAKDGSTQSNIKGVSRFLKTANVDKVLTGADCTSSGSITTSAGTIAKNGATVCADLTTNSYCISETSASGNIYALTSGIDVPYRAPTGCTSASSNPAPAVSNMLTSCEASFETSSACLTNASNETVAWSQDFARSGSSSAKVSLLAPASGCCGSAWIGHPATNPIPAIAGVTYTAVVSMKPGTYSGVATLALYYYSNAGVLLSTNTADLTLTAGGAWQQAAKTAQAPSGTGKVALAVWLSTSVAKAGETVYLDQFGLWTQNSTVWAPPA